MNLTLFLINLLTQITEPFLSAARSLSVPATNNDINDNANNTLIPRDAVLNPTCTPSTPLSNCLFGTVWNMQTLEAAMYAFDHNCVEIGYNPLVEIPNNMLHDWSFDSQLKYAVVVTLDSTVGDIYYAGKGYYFYMNPWPSKECHMEGLIQVCEVPFTC